MKTSTVKAIALLAILLTPIMMIYTPKTEIFILLLQQTVITMGAIVLLTSNKNKRK